MRNVDCAVQEHCAGSSGCGIESGNEDEDDEDDEASLLQRSTSTGKQSLDDQQALSPANSTASSRRIPKKRDFYGLHDHAFSLEQQQQQQTHQQPEQLSPAYGGSSTGSLTSSQSSAMARELGVPLRFEDTRPIGVVGPLNAPHLAQAMQPMKCEPGIPLKCEPEFSCVSFDDRLIYDTAACAQGILQRESDPRAFQQASHGNVSHILAIERSNDPNFEFRVMSEVCCGNYVCQSSY